jgi:hypothetical protein
MDHELDVAKDLYTHQEYTSRIHIKNTQRQRCMLVMVFHGFRGLSNFPFTVMEFSGLTLIKSIGLWSQQETERQKVRLERLW